MIETLSDRPTLAPVALPADVAAAFAAFRGQLAARSQIVWGEHCSECAYPACYAHCAFYTPRTDFNCRRFEAGFEPLAADPALHRVRFRKWGKLEGKGPALVRPIAAARAADRRDGQVSSLLATIPAPHPIKQSLAWRWNTHKGRAPTGEGPSADAFVVEAWASDGMRRSFTLTFLNTGGEANALYQVSLDIDAGYRRITLPLDEIAARVDLAASFLVQIEPIGEAEGVEAVFGVCDFVTLAADAVSPRPDAVLDPDRLAKVVVWDLDETLWTGVLAEDGKDGVALRPEAVEAIKRLDERGVLQSIASKNDANEAMAALESFGLAEYFLHPQIHWNPKSGSVAAVARALDLGIDSLVFIDDQPFERAEVEAAHPSVRTLPHTAVAELSAHPWFALPATPESRGRRALYRQEAERAVAFESAGADYPAFLRASGLRLSIAALAPADVERVFELSQRTNQLNFNGRKYTREAVEALLYGTDGRRGYTLRCTDRFGDYGLIGFVEAAVGAGLVLEFFMSCRVQRKRVEHAFFAWLGAQMAAAGAPVMRVAYTRTGRNGASRDMLVGLGFAPAGETAWEMSTTAPIADADIVTLNVDPQLALTESAA